MDKIKSHTFILIFLIFEKLLTDLYLTIGQNRLSQFPFQVSFKVSTSTPAKSTHNISSNSMSIWLICVSILPPQFWICGYSLGSH